MKKILILLGATFFSLMSFSQESSIYYDYGKLVFKKNTTAYLFGNNVRLRKEPTTASEELKQLPILEDVFLLEKTDKIHEINGIQSHWIKIKAGSLSGYILDYFISSSYTEDNGFIYLTRINKENNELYLEVRKVHQKEDATYDAEKIDIALPHGNIVVNSHNNKGLEGVTSIIQIDYMAEACGMEGGSEYLLLQKGEIINKIQISSTSEAGIFWQKEKILFPDDNDKLENNTIRFVQETGSVIDESSQWYETKIVERQHRLIDNKFVPEFRSKSQ